MSSVHDSQMGTPNESAFPWIIEHLLANPGTHYEIPLRTLYTLNSASQTGPPSPTRKQHTPGNAFPTAQQSLNTERHNLTTATAAAQLRSNLATQKQHGGHQSSSLPPTFVTSFVRKCFPSDLDKVDFPQALTALDYLKDLENRRNKEIKAALDRLGVTQGDLEMKSKMQKKYPGVVDWVEAAEKDGRTVTALYTQVFVGLRHWTLLNEMSLQPFDKTSCTAMLNTLYPVILPGSQFVPPTPQLTSVACNRLREQFWKYIPKVERKGPQVLTPLYNHATAPGMEAGWAAIRDALDRYLTLTGEVITRCLDVTEPVQSPSTASFESWEEGGRRKAHSGMSFSSSSNRGSVQSHQTRPSTSSSMSTHSRSASKDKPRPEQPPPVPEDPRVTKSTSGAFKRIAGELRRMRSRNDIRERDQSRPRTAVHGEDDNSVPSTTASSSPSKERKLRLKPSLKKMRSNATLRDLMSRGSTTAGGDTASEAPAFDVEEMKRKRAEWEASDAKGKHNSGSSVELK